VGGGEEQRADKGGRDESHPGVPVQLPEQESPENYFFEESCEKHCLEEVEKGKIPVEGKEREVSGKHRQDKYSGQDWQANDDIADEVTDGMDRQDLINLMIDLPEPSFEKMEGGDGKKYC